MARGNHARGTKNPLWLELLKVIGPMLVGTGIFTAVLTFHFEKEKEAATRLLNTITLLDKSKSQTVRAGAVTTLRVYLGRDYEKYQDRAIRVLACHLATEDDELVRETILNVLKEAKVDAVAPLVLMNQVLIDEIILSRREGEKSEYGISGEVELKVLFRANKTVENRSEGILTVKRDGEILAAETLDIAKEKDRNDLITNLTSRYPNLCEETAQQLRKQMLQIAVRQVSQSQDDTEPELTEQQRHNRAKDLLRASKEDRFCSSKLHDINKALVAVLRKNSTKESQELDLSKVFLVSSKPIDLKKAQLKGALLNYAVLYNVDLTDTVLEEAELKDALLDEVILKNADLNRANLAGANLASANLGKAKFIKADLCGATLVDANMAEATLDEANIYAADLTNAILANANLVNANMTGAILQRANLEGANLEGANLEDADLADANFKAKVLFSIDSKKFQRDLDKSTISEDLQQEFESNEFYLSQSATLSVEKTDQKWLINDKDNEKEYTIRKEERLNICTEAMIVPTELFRIDSNDIKKFQYDLDEGNVSKDFQEKFEYNAIFLSQNATCSIGEIEGTWLISDKDNEQRYTVRKEDGQLKIYEMTKLDPTELFSVDSKKFQSDLDKGTILGDLRQKFEENWIDFSENTAISVKEKGYRWLINDKDNKRSYTIRKEELLNVCKETMFDFEGIKKAKNWEKAIFDNDKWQKLSSPQS